MELYEIDLGSIWGFWVRPQTEIEEAFAKLRAEDPISFFEERDYVLDNEIVSPAGPGFWALTRHADIVEASRRADLFCSGQGTQITDLPAEFNEFLGSMINMDDPRHARLRRLVSRGFTPRALARIEQQVARVATELVDDLAEVGECDFVPAVAARLPLQIICEMMGIPQSHYAEVFEQSNILLSAGDPEYVESDTNVFEALFGAAAALAQIMTELAAFRATKPADDLTSALVHAEIDGERLDAAELASFFVLLCVAGNETTRNAISHALVALTEHPDQRQWWLDDLQGRSATAVEEIVRWATPIIHFRRTVTRDGVRLSDHEFFAGDKVVFWYNSANRDEAAFSHPERFDLSRQPNDHLGFGGPGPHYCLGAHLARQEIAVLYRELLSRFPNIHTTAPPERLRSNFINGIKHLPCSPT
ncbi:MAG: cytochrome P450 [Acidimicrobiia bacterium]|nr:cytochrome P450 [Acidimicrobiia bacterium]MCY4458595.1 cytochrome P450 [Acidimicrobiaceae bacterium]